MQIFTLNSVILISMFWAKCETSEDTFNSRLLVLEKKLENQATEILSLKETVSAQENTISDLTKKIADQKNDKKSMVTEILELKSKSFKNNIMIKQLMKLFKKTLSKNKDVDVDKIDSEETKQIKMIENIIHKKKRFVLDTVETVAFEATIAGGNIAHHTHIDDKIVFETVSLNVGNGYKSTNGTFIAPMSGIYVFSTSVMMLGESDKVHDMHVIIEKNNAEIAGAYGFSQGAYEHSSVTAAMDLKVGDTVAVTVERHEDITFYGDNLTSFMGFLLYAF